MAGDVIEVIEAAYRVELDEASWLGGVVDAARPILDSGMGCSGFLYDASDPGHLKIEFAAGLEPAHAERIVKAIESSTANRVAWTFGQQTCRTASEGPEWDDQPAAKLFRTLGFEDVLFVNGLDPTGRGCLLTARMKTRGRVPRGRRRAWSRLAAHIAAGYRLQRRLAGAGSALENGDAVLDNRGRAQHLSGVAELSRARTALKDAVAAVDRARGRLRKNDPDAALEAWKALTAGQWTLIDEVDNGGRRFIVARKNDPEVVRPLALSPRERQAVGYASLGHPNKLIAYELGISPSTVGVLLSRAAKKLGARSRAELVAAFARIR